MQASSVCTDQGFKGFPDGYVFRQHIVDAATTLAGDTTTIVVEGDEGIGITAFLAEIASTYPQRSLYLSVRNGSRITYTVPYLLAQLLPQINTLVGSSFDVENPTLPEWRKAVLRLQQLGRRNGKPILFIVDGLYHIPESESRYTDEIIADLLCIGVSEIKHIVGVGRNNHLGKTIESRGNSKAFELMPLSREEASLYLRQNKVGEEHVPEVLQISRGNPGILASACRLLRDGAATLTSAQTGLSNFLLREWRRLAAAHAGKDIHTLDSLYANVLFSRQSFTPEELEVRVPNSAQLLATLLHEERFLYVNSSGTIEISGATARKVLEGQLSGHRARIIQENIALLVQDPTSKAAVELLPSFYEEAGSIQELIGYLSPETLDLWFKQTASLNLLQRRTQLGLHAAGSGKFFPEIFRFSLETSAVRCFKQGVDDARSRIALLAEMEHFAEAFALSQAGNTAENRTILLAEYVRVAHRKKHPIDPLARSQLAQAIHELDESHDQDWVFDVATSIVGAYPDLAIAAIEKGAKGSTRDWALSRLAVQSLHDNRTDSSKLYASKIADSKLQEFITALGDLFNGKSLEGVKQIASDLPGKQRIFFLRNWLKNGMADSVAVEIAHFTLSEIERETSYSPTAADFCDIIQPAVFGEIGDSAKSLLVRLESQVGLVKGQSSSVDLIRFQLYLAAGLARYGASLEDRLLEIYYSCEDITDLGARVEAIAWVLSILSQIRIPPELERQHGFHDTFSNELFKCASLMLSSTAEHVKVAQGAINALTRKHPRLAIQLISRFNTEERRDEGLARTAELVVRNYAETDKFDIALECLSQIQDASTRSPALVTTLREIPDSHHVSPDDYEKLLKAAEQVGHPEIRVEAYISLMALSSIPPESEGAEELFKRFLNVVVDSDDRTLVPARLYRMLQHAARRHPKFAKTAYASSVEALKQVAQVPRAVAVTNYYLIRITNASFCALASQQLESPEHLLRIKNHLNSVPVLKWRVMLLNDLALGLHFGDRRDLRDKVCADMLLPMLTALGESYDEQYGQIVCEAIPALYIWNQATASSFLRKMGRHQQETATVELILTLLQGSGLLNPYNDSRFEHRQLTYDEALMITDALERLTTDATLVKNMESFVFALNNRLNKNSFSTQQRTGIATRLHQHAARCLPDGRNIKHEGWLIYADVVLAGLGDLRQVDWNSFKSRIANVPNESDQVLLFGLLSQHMPARLESDRKANLKLAEQKLSTIPSVVDRAMRAVHLSSSAGTNDLQVAERLLREAMDVALADDTADGQRIQREILDAAYTIDEKIAERLVERIDDDPARLRAKGDLKDRVRVHKGSSAISKADVDRIESASRGFGESSVKALASLNASRSVPPEHHKAIAVVRQAASGTLEANWAAYCWFIQAVSARAGRHPERARQLIVALHEMLQLSAELLARVGGRLSISSVRIPNDAASELSDNFAIAEHGTRTQLLSKLVSWITEGSEVNEVLMCDPYFKPEATDLIWMIHAQRPDATYCVLTHMKSAPEAEKLRLGVLERWRVLSDEACPAVAIIGCYYEDRPDQCPIHDRWVLTDNSGAQLGTSIADIGAGRLSAADRLGSKEVSTLREKLDKYLGRAKKNFDGRTLRYVLTSI